MQNDTNIAPTTEQAVAPVERPELKADRTWYSSLFTQLLAPLVATRYIWLALEDVNPLDILDKQKKRIKTDWGRYASRNFAAFGMGATVLGIMGMYSKNTLHDIKSIYAEAVGYELDKKPKDVTLTDVFIKSQNEALKITRETYKERSLLRGLTAATFFVPWHKLKPKVFQSREPNYETNANAGLGAVGVYLYGEGFLRKPSFFDVEQKLVSSKINHNDVDPYAAIQTQDVQALINLQRKNIEKHYHAPLAESPEGQNDIKLATRIAKLLNDTYDNKPDIGTDRFTLGKFNYLIGFGLLDKFPESLAYVELANKSTDMKDVKQAAFAIKNGQDPQAIFAQFAIDIQKLSAKPEQQVANQVNETKKFTQDISPKTLMDFASKSTEISKTI